jgi:hypothetical protein
MEFTIDQPKLRSQFTPGHIALIAGVLLLLGVFLFVKDPQYFKINFHHASAPSAQAAIASRYQPYVPAVQPAVLGASTLDSQGPEVLQEDGSVASASDPGAVLGANTQQLETDLAAINVKTVASTSAGVDNYLQSMSYWESTSIDQTQFEAALTSKNPAQINTQIQKMQTMLYYLENMTVPADAAQLHKLKIAQYRSSVTLLQNFSQADSNPQLVTDQLGVFLQSQEQQDQEAAALRQKYNLTS